MSHPLNADQIYDGYRLIRFLGRGGFGEVWLCQSEAVGDFRAFKWIPATDGDRLEKEYEALILYRQAVSQIRSPHLVPIEHINRNQDGLFYIMPLADGEPSELPPTDPAWMPSSLLSLIQECCEKPKWFSPPEIHAMILPLLEALQTLSDAGLVHRDVKPENILFFGGHPCLGDISLLGADAAHITRRGTPGYSSPSWYQGGLPDMYAAAATLYTLLTGNLPDKMGRAAFTWPPQGEGSLSQAERAEWRRLHAVIRRATDEKVAERFVDFRTMAAAISGAMDTGGSPIIPAGKRRMLSVGVITIVFGILIVAALAIFAFTRPEKLDRPPLPSSSATPQLPPEPKVPVEQPQPLVARDSATLDAQTAYNSLAWSQQDLVGSLDPFSSQYKLFQRTLGEIFNHTCVSGAFAPDLAVRKLDICLDQIEPLAKIPNAQLARLLLLQAAGDRAEVAKGIDDPAFITPGTDNLAYRVSLLTRLNAADKAEALLERILEESSMSGRKKSDTLILRTEVRVQLGKYAEAHSDAIQAIAANGKDAAMKADVEMKLLNLESTYPAYAAYLKSQPKK